MVSLSEKLQFHMVHLQIAFRQESSSPIEPRAGNEDKYDWYSCRRCSLEVAIESGERVELIDVNAGEANDEGGQKWQWWHRRC